MTQLIESLADEVSVGDLHHWATLTTTIKIAARIEICFVPLTIYLFNDTLNTFLTISANMV